MITLTVNSTRNLKDPSQQSINTLAPINIHLTYHFTFHYTFQSMFWELLATFLCSVVIGQNLIYLWLPKWLKPDNNVLKGADYTYLHSLMAYEQLSLYLVLGHNSRRVVKVYNKSISLDE